ncbi:transcriptional regulator [Nocardia nova SH22a]|uniref:Transcriptional regulator WhiB n=1 Tax=Nocardia nova SH22a TaxID=1415166 RepID=W5TEN9_9NOCA|nr:WhiB family transcriptional regulator [Nocardia nova]AHH17629.1 transcriptional regulator [Nocardia nova SH22a]
MPREKPLDLPAPHTDAWDWQLRAACRTQDVNVFYAEDEPRTTTAKRLCAHCPVLTRCRDHAITSHEPHGIWGGLTPSERAAYRWADRRLPRTRTA